MQRSKNIRLSVIFSLLVVVGIAVVFFDFEKPKENSESKFQLREVERVSQINFKGKINNSIVKNGNAWVLNNTYQADAQLVDLFLNILSRISVKRPVPKNEVQNVLSKFSQLGTTLEINVGGDSQSFQVLNDNGKTYFKEERGIPYEMDIPGYSSQVGSLFFLTENQWRNKVLFSSNFRTIKKLEVNNLKEPESSFRIFDNGDFIEVEGVEQMDTSIVMSYIQNLNYFDADGLINKGEYVRFDSLEENSKPEITMTISDIDSAFNNSILLFPKIPNDQYRFGITSDGQRFVLEESKARSLFPGVELFKAKN